MFQNLLSNGVLATVQSFDGSANMLSLTLHPEAGGGNLTAMIMDILQAQAKSSPCPSTTQKAEQTDSSTLASSICAASNDCPSTPETQKRLNSLNTPTGTPPETQTTAPQQRKNTSLTPEDGLLSHNFSMGFLNLVACLYYYIIDSKKNQSKLCIYIHCHNFL